MRTLILILLTFSASAQEDPYLLFSKYHKMGVKGDVKTITTYTYQDLDYDKDAALTVSGKLSLVEKKCFNQEGYMIRDSTYSIVLHKGYTFNSYNNYYYSADTNIITVITYRIYSNSIHASDSMYYTYNQINDSTHYYMKYPTLTDSSLKPTPPDMPMQKITVTLNGKNFVSANIKNYHHKNFLLNEYSYYYEEDGNAIRTEGSIVKNHKYSTLILKKDDKGNTTQMISLYKKKRPQSMTRYEIEYYD